MNTARQPSPTKPLNGSFPLDHAGACKAAMDDFLQCIRAMGKHHRCREQSMRYLACRMERNLMDKQPLDHIGFSDAQRVVEGASRGQREVATAHHGGNVEGRSKKKPNILGL